MLPTFLPHTIILEGRGGIIEAQISNLQVSKVKAQGPALLLPGVDKNTF